MIYVILFVDINKFNVFEYTIPLKMTRSCIFEFQIVISVDISHKMKKNSALLHCCIVALFEIDGFMIG